MREQLPSDVVFQRPEVGTCHKESVAGHFSRKRGLEHLEDEGSPAIVPRTLATGSLLGLFEVDRQAGDATSEPR
jgi:hypothetical protein